MWLALDHAEPDNGCLWSVTRDILLLYADTIIEPFRYVKDSHKQGMRTHQVSGVLGFSQKCTDYSDVVW